MTEKLKHEGPSHYIVAPETYPECRLCRMQDAAPELLEDVYSALGAMIALNEKEHPWIKSLAERFKKTIAKVEGK